MLKIRLSRVGRKHEPVYRLILTDSRNPAQTGKAIEVLGSYDSRRGEKAIFDGEKVNYWVSKGAQISPTVHNILVNKGIIKGKKRSVLPKSVIEKAKKKAEPQPSPEATAGEAEPIQETPIAEAPVSEPEATPEATVEEAPSQDVVAEEVTQ